MFIKKAVPEKETGNLGGLNTRNLNFFTYEMTHFWALDNNLLLKPFLVLDVDCGWRFCKL
jgi:hypothetical protein